MAKEQCEFCGEKKKTTGTMFVGVYCIECHRAVIEMSREAIKEIKAQK